MKVILGVTGCIGAYKAAILLRLLQKQRFEVLPVMTRHAQQFITPLTLEKLSGNRVISDLFSDHSLLIDHIALARESDVLLVAPATANLLGKLARGVADDFLSTLYLSTTTPVVVAPAMNVEMWHHPATQENVRVLQGRGVVIVEPGVGDQACGEKGEGRLAEPEKIVQVVLKTLKPTKSLMGNKVLVTAGPTIEDIDPVRYFSNRSGGKMGYAIADEAQQRGASVVLVSGPTHLEPPQSVVVISVRSCSEMAQAVFDHFSQVDVLVMAAAVSDFTPARIASQKIKKEGSARSIQLEPTIDILQELGEKKNRQILVGFSADSENIRENARKKIQEKGLDLIVANDISGTEQGFQVDMNQVILINSEGNEKEYPILPKKQVAKLLWNRIEKSLHLLSGQDLNRPSQVA